MMQFAGVDQVESPLTDVLESRNNLAFEWPHTTEVSLVTSKVQVQMLAREAIRYAGETSDWVLDYFANNLLPILL